MCVLQVPLVQTGPRRRPPLRLLLLLRLRLMLLLSPPPFVRDLVRRSISSEAARCRRMLSGVRAERLLCVPPEMESVSLEPLAVRRRLPLWKSLIRAMRAAAAAPLLPLPPVLPLLLVWGRVPVPTTTV